MTWGKVYWPIFIISTSIAFGVPELVGVFTNRANTLSAYSWEELHVGGGITIHTLAWYVSLVCWGIFVSVITAHIWFKGP